MTSTINYFEGPEKKVELVSATPTLRDFGDRWRTIVSAAEAEVLSLKSNDYFDAYLLSESSLFVYDDHATMITCGKTRLAAAVLEMIEMVGKDNVALLVYERKNEHFPAKQHSTFLDDAALLRAHLGGRALRFGAQHGHCIELFVSEKPYQPDESDITLEVLMHGLDASRAASFRAGAAVRSASTLGLDALVGTRAVIDEYAFEPAGYSLNALVGPYYYTVHVTPEDEGSYASFETNWDFRSDPSALVARVVAAFEPESFDVLAFAPSPESIDCSIDGYVPRKQMRAEVAGYEVSFRSFFRPLGLESAVPIRL